MNKKVKKVDFLNRHEKPMPLEPKVVEIINNDFEGENIIKALWCPFTDQIKREYIQGHITFPSKGFLGTCREITGVGRLGIGYHAWEQNKHEFIYYRILDEEMESWKPFYWHRGI